MSAQADEQDVDEPSSHLVERLQRTSDRATRVRRHEIPTGDGQRRPVGRPAVEDTRLQLAVTRLLTASDAQDVLRCREGYRPHMGAVDAGDTRTITRPLGRDHGVVAAAMQGCFDAIDQAWMLRRVAERLEDRALRRVIKTWLNAGRRDTDGTVRPPVTGTPHGGTVAPILAHVYLHDAVDRWFDRVVKPPCRGEVCLIRYADDGAPRARRRPKQGAAGVRHCTTDEGRPLGTGWQEQVPNHLRRRWSKAMVVSAGGKGLESTRSGDRQEEDRKGTTDDVSNASGRGQNRGES